MLRDHEDSGKQIYPTGQEDAAPYILMPRRSECPDPNNGHERESRLCFLQVCGPQMLARVTKNTCIPPK
jgi:hypothetical protein